MYMICYISSVRINKEPIQLGGSGEVQDVGIPQNNMLTSQPAPVAAMAAS